MLRQLVATLALFFVLFVATSAYPLFEVPSADFNLSVSTDASGLLTFKYFLLHNTTSVYSLTLKNLWEADNSNLTMTAVSNYTLDSWSTSATKGPTTNGSQYWSVSARPLPGRWASLVLNISVPLNSNGPNATDFAAAYVQFLLNGYNWSNADSATNLVFTWNAEYTNPVVQESVTLNAKASRTVDFGNAYFALNTTDATVGNDTTDAALYPASKYTDSLVAKQDIYVVYDHFDGDLDHEVQMGFGSGPGSSLWWIIIIVVVIIAIVVIILIAVIGFVLVRRRRRSYDSF